MVVGIIGRASIVMLISLSYKVIVWLGEAIKNKYGSVQELRSTFGHLKLFKDLLELGLIGFSLVWLVLVWF